MFDFVPFPRPRRSALLGGGVPRMLLLLREEVGEEVEEGMDEGLLFRSALRPRWLNLPTALPFPLELLISDFN